MERDQWEYILADSGDLEQLNDLGAEGWEAICDLPGGRGMLMKRKKDSLVPVDNDPEPGIPAVCQ